MPFLLDNRLAPLTSSWGFLRAPLDTVVRSYVRWQHLILHTVRATRMTLGLEDVLRRLEPLDFAGSRVLFQSTQSDWTAVFGNSIGGRPPVAYMSERLSCRGLDCVAFPNTITRANRGANARGVWGAVELTLYAPRSTDASSPVSNRERCIRVSNDVSGWQFYSHGTPQPYEEATQYALKRTADRFTTEMLERYGRALGLELFDPGFYRGPSVLTRSRLWLLPAPPSMTLEQARVRLGFMSSSELP